MIYRNLTKDDRKRWKDSESEDLKEQKHCEAQTAFPILPYIASYTFNIFYTMYFLQV